MDYFLNKHQDMHVLLKKILHSITIMCVKLAYYVNFWTFE